MTTYGLAIFPKSRYTCHDTAVLLPWTVRTLAATLQRSCIAHFVILTPNYAFCLSIIWQLGRSILVIASPLL